MPATVVLPFLEKTKLAQEGADLHWIQESLWPNCLGSLQGVKTVQNKNSVENREKQEAA